MLCVQSHVKTVAVAVDCCTSPRLIDTLATSWIQYGFQLKITKASAWPTSGALWRDLEVHPNLAEGVEEATTLFQ